MSARQEVVRGHGLISSDESIVTTMIFMRITGLVIGLLVALAAPAAASDVRPGVGASFNGSSGVLTGNNAMALTDVPVQLPAPGVGVLGSGHGGDADR